METSRIDSLNAGDGKEYNFHDSHYSSDCLQSNFGSDLEVLWSQSVSQLSKAKGIARCGRLPRRVAQQLLPYLTFSTPTLLRGVTESTPKDFKIGTEVRLKAVTLIVKVVEIILFAVAGVQRVDSRCFHSESVSLFVLPANKDLKSTSLAQEFWREIHQNPSFITRCCLGRIRSRGPLTTAGQSVRAKIPRHNPNRVTNYQTAEEHEVWCKSQVLIQSFRMRMHQVVTDTHNGTVYRHFNGLPECDVHMRICDYINRCTLNVLLGADSQQRAL